MKRDLNRKEFLRLMGIIASGAFLNPQQLFATNSERTISNEKKESEKDKKVGDADNKLPKFSHSEDSKGSSVTLKQKIMGGGAMTKIIGGDNKSKEKNAGPSYRDKEAKNISEHLAKLKSNPDDKKDTLASKMPSRAEDDEKDTDRDAGAAPVIGWLRLRSRMGQ